MKKEVVITKKQGVNQSMKNTKVTKETTKTTDPQLEWQKKIIREEMKG